MRSLPAAPPAGGPTFRASSSRGERCVQTGWYGFAKDVSEPLLVASERMRRVNPERSAYDLYGDPGTLSTAPRLGVAASLNVQRCGPKRAASAVRLRPWVRRCIGR